MLKIKQTTALKLIEEIIKTKSLPKDVNIILSGLSFNQAATNVSALANTNGGLIIYGITKQYGHRNITNIDKFINKINQELECLNIKIETPLTIIKNNGFNVIIQEVPKLPFEQIPIRKEYHSDATSYYIKNNQITKIPTYMLNSIRAIKNLNIKEGICENYKVKYDDIELRTAFLEKYRKNYKTIYELKDTEIIQSLFPNYSNSIFYILLFSYLPQHFYPYLYINISDRRKDFKEYKVTGSIPHMLKMTMLQIKKLIRGTLKIDKEGKLINKNTYIFEIIYELLYNALIHRDYTYINQGAPINVYLYNNKITITNPGYYLTDNNNYLYSKIKYTMNRSLKITMDLLSHPHKHGFKYIRRMSHIYKCKEPVLYNNEGEFVATIYSMQEESIYKEPYTIETIGAFCMEPKTKVEIYNHFFETDKKDYGYFYNKYIEPLIDNGILEFLYPDKPTTKFQKIKTSEKGIEMLFEY